MRVLSESKRISLWLLPPEPISADLLSVQKEIIASHPPDRCLPTFLPHVTLIGGIPISECVKIDDVSCQDPNGDIDEEAAKIVLKRLQHAFRGFGGVECRFVPDRGVFAARQPPDNDIRDGVVQWNQSCVAVMERTKDFVRAMQVADKALFPEYDKYVSIERHFKTPLLEPHYSYAYGNDPELIPATLVCPPSFKSTEMVIMWTYPTNLDSVEKWREIGRFSLV